MISIDRGCQHAVSIELDLPDLHEALDEAWQRQFEAIDRLACEPSLQHRSGVDTHWIGVIGEMAWARLRDVEHVADVHYTGKRPDGAGWEVRTRTGRDHELAVKDSDPDRTPLILLLAHDLPRVCVAGVITAGRARRIGRPNPRLGPHIYLQQKQLAAWDPRFLEYVP